VGEKLSFLSEVDFIVRSFQSEGVTAKAEYNSEGQYLFIEIMVPKI
jgi:hypothetical protein